MANLTQLSKFLALILRHQADKFNLPLDEQGFTEVALVWALVQNHFGNGFSYQDLETVVVGDQHGKKRYELVDGRIRALFGHSAVRAINYSKVIPPTLLYHGTSQTALAAIRATGLKAGQRQYVHLTTNLRHAKRVAIRHSDDIIILTVHAFAAHEAGIVFHQPEAEHFLCTHVPVQFLQFSSIVE